MSSDKYFLRSDVKIEPLVNSWYAWSFLISPITFPLVTKNLHLRILDSYLRAPAQHQKAVADRALKGGLFVDHQGTIDEIAGLVSYTNKELSELLSFAADIGAASETLLQLADGASLRSLYRDLPESLKGRVELVYDLFNRPKIRFIENLFYCSDFYKPSLQAVSLSLLDGDKRPFVLSSPRLATEDNIIVKIPFADLRWDEFFRLRNEALPLEQISKLIQLDALPAEKQALFMDMLTTEAPHKKYLKPSAGKVRVRYFGHATVLIETANVSILTDPIISYDINNNHERFGFNDLPEYIDYVVLTHNHQDHVMLETLLQLRHRLGTIVVGKNIIGELLDPSLKLMLRAIGFSSVIELDELESIDINDGKITGVPFLGEHGDLNIMSKLAFHIELSGNTFIFAADSDNLSPDLYRHIHTRLGDIDHVFIGMECAGAPLSWVYGPLFTKPLLRKHDQDRRLNGSNCERAFKLVEQFKPKSVYVYAMGAEPWLEFISSIEYTETSEPIVQSDKLIAACQERGVTAERLYGKKELNF